jgi:hypothetical protein
VTAAVEACDVQQLGQHVVVRLPGRWKSLAGHGGRSESAGVSRACFRMRNGDVIDLYDRVKVGTRVVVI